MWKVLEYFDIDPIPVLELNPQDFGGNLNPKLKIFDEYGRLDKPKLTAGGGHTKRVQNRKAKFEEATQTDGPITMCDCPGWLGNDKQGWESWMNSPTN